MILRIVILILCFVSSKSMLSLDTLHFFSAKADVEIEQNNRMESYTAHFRYKFNDSLWISFTGTLGIEGMRMLMTKDCTFIINKLDRSVYVSANEDENIILPISMKLSDWNLILLNQRYPEDSATLVQRQGEDMSYTYFESKYIKSLVQKKDQNIYQANFRFQEYNCTFNFSEFKSIKNHSSIASNRSLKIMNGGNEWKIKINFLNYTINNPLSLPFDITKYKNAKD